MNEKKDQNILFWILLGPLFLLTTLFVTAFAPISSKDLFLFSIFALAFCQKKKQMGLFYSLVALVILATYKHLFTISSGHLWQLGIEFSFALGLFISYFSFEHVTDILTSFDQKQNSQKELLEKMEQELKKEADFHLRQHKNFQYEIERVNLQLEEKKLEIATLKNQSESLKASLREVDLEKEKFVSQFKDKERQIQLLRETIDEYKEQMQILRESESIEEFDKIKLEKEKIESFSKIIEKSLEDKTLQYEEKEEALNALIKEMGESKNQIELLLKEKQSIENEVQKLENEIANKNNTEISLDEKQSYENQIIELKKIQSLYFQLKVQFEEKKKILEESRKELFLANEKISSFNKAKELQALDETVMEKDLTIQLGSFENEHKRLEEENIHLQDIVTILTRQIERKEDLLQKEPQEKKAPSRKKNTKKEDLEAKENKAKELSENAVKQANENTKEIIEEKQIIQSEQVREIEKLKEKSAVENVEKISDLKNAEMPKEVKKRTRKKSLTKEVSNEGKVPKPEEVQSLKYSSFEDLP